MKTENMKGLFLTIDISADNEVFLVDALQRIIEEIKQGNRVDANGSYDYHYNYSIDGKAIEYES